MASYRTSLAFARLPDAALNSFAETVVAEMDANPAFPSPPVSMINLGGQQIAFAEAIVAQGQGGTQATAAKNAARETLIDMLRADAAYVTSVARNDLAKLLSSGYDAVSNNRERIVLSQPVVERLDNPMSTQLGLRLKPVPTAHSYEVRISYGAGGWQGVGVFTSSRNIIIPDLTPGTVYTVQARAVGGITGYSDWSNPVSRMAM
jgi:hypothetical protein